MSDEENVKSESTASIESIIGRITTLTGEGHELFNCVIQEVSSRRRTWQEAFKLWRDQEVPPGELPLPASEIAHFFLDDFKLDGLSHFFCNTILNIEFDLKKYKYEKLITYAHRLSNYTQNSETLREEMIAHPERIKPEEREMANGVIAALEKIPANARAIMEATQELSAALKRTKDAKGPDTPPSRS